MAKSGRLPIATSGSNVPLDAPLYNKPPIYYKNVESISFTYETDEAAALDILPEELALTSPPTATLIFVNYPFSTLGPYYEVMLGLSCSFNNEPHFYIPYLVVDSDIPHAAGREIWGYAKKFALIKIEKEGDLIIGTMERPKGNRICTAVIRPEIPLAPVEGTGGGSISLRVIPSPDGSPKPSLAELIETPTTSTTIDAYSGEGFLQFNSTSTFDPWHKLAVNRVLSCVYRRYDSVLHPGKVIKRY